MRALDYLHKNKKSSGCFASNAFTNNEARVFFENLEELGATVTIEDDAIMVDWDGPGEDYVDSCTVSLPDDGVNSLKILRLIKKELPDEMDVSAPDGIWLWWD